MTNIGWEWIAGFFEGEGNIFWQEGKRGTKSGMGGRCTIGQKVKAPLQAVYEFLIKIGFDNPAFYLRPPAKGQRYPTELWILTVQKRKDVISFLENTIPFLFQKKEKAQFVLGRLRDAIHQRDKVLNKAMSLKEEGKTWLEIARALHVNSVTIRNYARSKGINLDRSRGFDNDMDWRDDRIARGLCESCGKPRGIGGTIRKCRKCADRYNKWRNKYRRDNGRKDRTQKESRP